MSVLGWGIASAIGAIAAVLAAPTLYIEPGMMFSVLLYALAENVHEKPDGITISAFFIAGILAVSIWSRLSRAFELRVTEVNLDRTAQMFIRDCARRTVRLVANEPGEGDANEYAEKRLQIMKDHDLTDEQDFIFVEITVAGRVHRVPRRLVASYHRFPEKLDD